MALSQDALDVRHRQDFRTRFSRRAGMVLWDTFLFEEGGGSLPTPYFESEKDLLEWCSATVHSFDQECELSTLDYELQRVRGLPDYALNCHHREGSFNKLKDETVACCLHVANVISVSCFLFCLRIGIFEDANGSVIDKSGLMDHLSILADKWKWNSISCQDTFRKFTDYINDLDESDEMEEAMKLLYQWTLFPLSSVLVSIEAMTNSCASIGNGQYIELINSVSKCSDEVCEFMEHYRMLFMDSTDTEFFYNEMFKSHTSTADFHLRLGNHVRAKELLTSLESMLDDTSNNRLMVTRWGNGKVEYLKWQNTIKTLAMKEEVSDLLKKSNSPDYQGGLFGWDVGSSSFYPTFLKMKEIVRDEELDVVSVKGAASALDEQLREIINLLGKERVSEARKIFYQLDFSNLAASNLALLRKFLAFLGRPEVKLHVCNGSLNWELFWGKQDLLLDVSEILGDRQLTAKILEESAIMVGQHSNESYNDIKMSTGNSPNDFESLQLWLREELNLKLDLPPPQCIQDVISCLRDPCKSDEHKRHLPDKLKAYRFLKRSMDISSELLYIWTEKTSNEAQWLKILESQKSVHELLIYFLLEISQLCNFIKIGLESSAVAADDGLLSKPSALKNNHENLQVYSALVHVFVRSALVWVERGRARTLLAELGPWYYTKLLNPDSWKEELIDFDKDEEVASSSIFSCRLACKGKPLFVEYVSHTLDAANAPTMYRPTQPVAFMINDQRSKGVTCVPLDSRADTQVEGLVNKFYEMVESFCETKPLPRRLDDGVVKKLHSILEGLYDILIEPFSKHVWFKQLDPKDTIIFVPDKVLYRVPFALLRDKKTQTYLFQLHPIAIAPSLRVLQHCKRRIRDLEKYPLKADGCILAVGNPSYSRETLPGTGKELEHLQSCFPARVRTLEKDEATRDNFLELVKEASDSKEQHVFAFMHLGVHGHWSNSGYKDEESQTGRLQFAKSPQQTEASKGPTMCIDITGQPSQTAMPNSWELSCEAESSRDSERRTKRVFGEVGAATRAPEGYYSTAANDMLPSEDIIKSGFEWRTRLVVLSACNSSRGQGYSDGEVNLPRALMIAGVPTAVVSQWKVSDVGAPKLMQAFYENLQCGQDVATALQSAMLQIFNSESESANNIFEWGTFLVWGLPSVRLPKELRTKSPLRSLPVRHQAALLRYKFDFDHLVDPTCYIEAAISNLWNDVDSFLKSVSCNTLVLEEEEIIDDIRSIQDELLHHNRFNDPQISNEVIALACAEFDAMLPAVKPFTSVEIEVGNRYSPIFLDYLIQLRYRFSFQMIFTQVINGRHQLAQEYANNLIEVVENADAYDESIVRWSRANEGLLRQERAVILRLEGKHGEALKEFEELLAPGEDYECLIEMSYLKHLINDRSGALEYARRAKNVESPPQPGYLKFRLGFKSLPDDYGHQWLLDADAKDAGASSSRVTEKSFDRTKADNVKQGVNILLELEPVLMMAWPRG